MSVSVVRSFRKSELSRRSEEKNGVYEMLEILFYYVTLVAGVDAGRDVAVAAMSPAATQKRKFV